MAHTAEEADEVYHVEVITKARVAPPSSDDEDEEEHGPSSKRKRKGKNKELKKPKWEYLVKWAGYDSRHNSWEPEENVAGCQRLLASFWAHVGTDDNDYDIGYEVAADEKWIKKEKRFFSKEYSEAEVRLWKQREKDEFNRKKKTRKRKASGEASRRSTFTKSRTNSLAISDESSDDLPLIARKREAIEASDDDEPLIKLPLRKKVKTNPPAVDTNVSSKKPSGDEVITSDDNWAASLFSSPEPEVAPRALPTPAPLPVPMLSTLPLPLPPVSRHSASKSQVPAAVPQNIASTSRLVTKKQLSSGALALVPPKDIPRPTSKSKNQMSLPRSSSSTSLMPLSFKKSTLSTSNMVPDTLNVDDAQVSIPPREAIPTTSSRVLSPNREHLDGKRLPECLASSHNAHMNAADAFLREIMPPALAAPLKPAEEQPFEPQPPRGLISDPAPIPKRLPPPWTWSGNVFTETDPSKPLFSVTFCDVTAFVNGGLRFSVVMATMDHLHFTTFHDAEDLDSVLSACQGVHQFARLGPKSNLDIEGLGIFSSYLAKMQKIILLPVFLDNLTVGHIVFFHHTTRVVSSRLKPPSEVQTAGSLVAALVPWILSSGQLSRHHRYPANRNLPAQAEIDPLVKDETQWALTVRIKPRYHYGLRLLKFPRSLHAYLSDDGHERTFSVWFEGGDGTRKKPGLDTIVLFKILEKCRTKHSRIRDARIIFIHVGALECLEKLPGLLEICSSSFSVQFYTYGTHETIAPEFWGVREIYPCGGIVTFTPQALLDDPIGVQHRISQIHSHPMWECYIIPSVLGMVAKLFGQNDPIADFDSGKFPYTRLLHAIDEGELSFMTSPSSYDGPQSTKSVTVQQEWLKRHWSHRPHGPRTILQASLDAFNEKYAKFHPTERESGILDEISKDLRCMRKQPVLMGKYRRYVVIDSPRVQPRSREDALEWTSAAKFDFKDDFFPLQS